MLGDKLADGERDVGGGMPPSCRSRPRGCASRTILERDRQECTRDALPCNRAQAFRPVSRNRDRGCPHEKLTARASVSRGDRSRFALHTMLPDGRFREPSKALSRAPARNCGGAKAGTACRNGLIFRGSRGAGHLGSGYEAHIGLHNFIPRRIPRASGPARSPSFASLHDEVPAVGRTPYFARRTGPRPACRAAPLATGPSAPEA